jgi:hypothetical protein
VIEPLEAAWKKALIPSNGNSKTTRELDAREKDFYGARNLIENFFARLKQYHVGSNAL